MITLLRYNEMKYLQSSKEQIFKKKHKANKTDNMEKEHFIFRKFRKPFGFYPAPSFLVVQLNNTFLFAVSTQCL